jgi:hypothetical protein
MSILLENFHGVRVTKQHHNELQTRIKEMECHMRQDKWNDKEDEFNDEEEELWIEEKKPLNSKKNWSCARNNCATL